MSSDSVRGPNNVSIYCFWNINISEQCTPSNPFNYSYFLLKPQKKGPRIIKIIKTASTNLTSHFTVTKSGESTKTKQMLIILEKNW